MLGALGKREREDGGVEALAEEEREPVRRQAMSVAMRSALLGVGATGVVAALGWWLREIGGR